MKKKDVEKISEKRLERITGLELLLGKRREEIKALKLEIEGYKQTVGILSAFILEGVEKSEKVEIPLADIRTGLEMGYDVDIREDKYVITKRG